MLDLTRHIVEKKSDRFAPDGFEDHYETALIDLINSKRAGKPITPKERPRGDNVVDLMEALRRSVGQEAAPASKVQEATQGRQRSEGNANADRGQEAEKGGRNRDAGHATTEVGLVEQTGQVSPIELSIWLRMTSVFSPVVAIRVISAIRSCASRFRLGGLCEACSRARAQVEAIWPLRGGVWLLRQGALQGIGFA
jgi:hypothetical protein